MTEVTQEAAVHRLILAAVSPDNTPHGYNLTFAFPMVLFIVIAGVLYLLFRRPHRRIPATPITPSAAGAGAVTPVEAAATATPTAAPPATGLPTAAANGARSDSADSDGEQDGEGEQAATDETAEDTE